VYNLSTQTAPILIRVLKARIKKIMQKDEEVGKVAQATPVAICGFLKLLKAFYGG
jgi:hypothetical protein